MPSPFGPLRLIVNPRAGRGVVGRTLPTLTEALRANDLEFDVVETTGVRYASEAAAQALGEGVRYLVAVGGDGTVHEVVNGMFDGDEPIAPDAVLGVAGMGQVSGGDGVIATPNASLARCRCRLLGAGAAGANGNGPAAAASVAAGTATTAGSRAGANRRR